MSRPKVLVCQHGARQRYAIPRMLEEAGMLAALYTDSCAHSPLGRAARLLAPIANGRVHRLLQRRIDGIPREKVFSSDRPFLSDLGSSLLRRRETPLEGYQRQHRVLSRRMIRWGLQDADIVYAQNAEDYDFLRYAKDAGKTIVMDVNANPLTHRIMAALARDYPGWGLERYESSREMVEAAFKRSAALADVLLCPSEWVAEGVRELTPRQADKIRICPYGSSIDYGGRINNPVPGRILFAGGDAARKGLPVLAEAAERLKAKYPELDFRVAGLVPGGIVERPECRHFNFLGKLSWERMKGEYLAADVFVLPTYSEGLAGVVVEALAAGCPVITTRCAGIEIASMENGVLIEPGDAHALAEAIETVFRNRPLRNRLADNTRQLATKYSKTAWQRRLVCIVSRIFRSA
ncbi:MAG TPA: glycosyltransferase family 4 protein [Sedimentisphaerales bacterium]|nr:glycosyltransferase family 4 protein [Sedimentisphaerales bacterium]HRS09720.1 glycosyltransferase family 4 protein [Sedimentisphaerales bacterium]HRV46630.1 glycosyltransferase family 4 protein [Sedimentisphaerales bacterium]